MAYMNQERKATIAADLKKVIPAGWKYSLSVNNHSTIVLTIRQAPVDLIGHIASVQDELGTTASVNAEKRCWKVNEYYPERQFRGELLNTFKAIIEAMDKGNHNNSDPQTDYYDVGWYTDINIGLWNAPFLDTVPAPVKGKWNKSYPSPAKNLNKPKLSQYEQYLPYGWSKMSPGKKAAATKKAMQMAA